MHRTAKVLVLSPEPLVAALVGMLLELEAYEPVFAAAEESPEDAVTRVRPLAAIMLDRALDAARSDLFFARIAKRRLPVVLFAEPAASADIEVLAQARGLPFVVLPTDRATLGRVLRSTTPGDVPRSGTDRRAPSAYSAPDGTLVYHDRTGQRWFVYDRRTGGERRGSPRERGEPPHRAFISESGEEWRFPIARGQPLEATASALEWQLARAKRVEGSTPNA